MDITLRYAVTRTLLQHWYAYMWRTRLWKYHAALVVIGAGVSALSYAANVRLFFAPVLGAFAIIALLLVFPQLSYKPQTRELILSPAGWTTTIGHRFGSAVWSDMAEIADRGGYIAIIRKNLNALIIPNSAFASPEQRRDVLAQMREWLAVSSHS